MILLDMEIPKSCFDCRFRADTGRCELTGFYTSYQPLTMPLSELCPIKAEIPKNATNGDVLLALYPHEDLLIGSEEFGTNHNEIGGMRVLKEWWNAPWKGEENECCK